MYLLACPDMVFLGMVHPAWLDMVWAVMELVFPGMVVCLACPDMVWELAFLDMVFLVHPVLESKVGLALAMHWVEEALAFKEASAGIVEWEVALVSKEELEQATL